MLRVASLGLNWLTRRMVFIWSPLFELSRDSIQPLCQRLPSGPKRAPDPWKPLPRYPRIAGENSLLSPCIIACCVIAAALAPRTSFAQPLGGSSAPPGPRDAFTAFSDAREFLDNWTVGALPDHGATTATVVLRLEGELIGRGSAHGTGCVGAAVTTAILDAERRLALPADALREQRLRELGGQMTLSLELGGPLVPVPKTQLAELAFTLAPGLDGIAVRLGDRVAFLSPGWMLAIERFPADSVRQLIVGLTGEAQPPELNSDRLAERTGADVLSFRTIHLVELEPGDVPIVLHRGGRIVEPSDLRSADLVAWADSIARHLLTRQDDFGDYRALDDRVIEGRARPEASAFVALALARYAAAGRVDPQLAVRARARALELAPPDAGGLVPALRTLTLAALGDPVDQWQPAGAPGFAAAIEAAALAVTPGAQDKAEQMVRELWEQTEPGRHVGLMPFLGWAELELAEDGERVPAGPALRAVRELVWQHQLVEADTGERERDLVGGIVFTQQRTPIPTGQTALPIAMTAGLLGDPRLTPDAELAGEVQTHLRSLRFLRQLTIDEPAATMFPRPDRAIGGVRRALWDQRVSTEATAMTLIAICDTLASLEAIAERRRTAPEDR